MTDRIMIVTVPADTYDWLKSAGQLWGSFLGEISPFSSGEALTPEQVAKECIERMHEQVEAKREGSK